jgi:hypothetical protein
VRWSVVIALILGLTVVSAVKICSANETFYGLGAFGATQYHDDPIWHTTENFDWREYHINPIIGRHQTDRWDVWLEGNLGYVNWDEVPDSVEVGASVLTSYDVLSHKGWSLFGEIGAGVGWMTNTPDENLVDNSFLGFLDYGFGIKARTKQGFVFKVGPRFHHRSGLFVVDAGMNGYGVMFSVTR